MRYAKKLSVIIPAYNEELFIGDLLNQLSGQMLKSVEVVVVDNNSEDNTAALVKKHQSTLPLTLLHHKTKGVSSARNVGAEESSGEWLLYLDADVHIPQGFLKEIMGAIKDPIFQVAGMPFYPRSDKRIDRLAIGLVRRYFRSLAKTKHPLTPGFAMLVRKDLHDTIGGFDESLSYSEDTDYLSRAVKAGGAFSFLPEPHVLMSVRRLEEAGRLKMFATHIYTEVVRFFRRGRVKSGVVKYHFGHYNSDHIKKFPPYKDTHLVRHEFNDNGQTVYYWTNQHRLSRQHLLLIHGFRGTHKGLSGLAGYLEEYNITIPDLPGFGESVMASGAQYSITSTANSLDKLRQEVGADKTHVIGHSLGAIIGIEYARLHTSYVKSLILLNPSIQFGFFSKLVAGGFYNWTLWLPVGLRNKLYRSKTIHAFENKYLINSSDKKSIAAIKAGRREELEYFNEHVARPAMNQLFAYDAYKVLQSLDMPIYILGGSRDKIAGEKDLNRIVGSHDITLQIMDGAGHLSPIEIPSDVSSYILGFTNSLD